MNGFSYSEMRFHKMRAGGWLALCEGMGITSGTLQRMMINRDVDRLHNGGMVNIGGILAKRCVKCEVTRQLDSFQNDRDKKSGVGGHCNICRGVFTDES